ncbi:MAG: host attachment protein [Proteobacteria bacterium]|nr:host attachment protein [Pseudomonadota bacterium]
MRRKSVVTWVLVADGARAKIFESVGHGGALAPAFDYESAAPHAASREIASDRPGRTFDSSGLGRHAKQPPTDPHEYEKAKFLREMSRRLEEGYNSGAFRRLVLVAPPKALGELRATLSGPVRAAVAAEVNKDLTHLPLPELASQLKDLVKPSLAEG